MRTENILVVDDEPTNRQIVSTLLGQLGYSVEEAINGEEALNRISERPPDLVLLDVVMPGQDGYAVCRRLKSDPKTRLIPVIMLTSLGELPDKLRALDLGADEFLRKPFNPAELVTRVRSLLSLKRFTDDLEHASKVLAGIAEVVENRDRYTANHCRRLGGYGTSVGAALGLDEADLDLLRLGGVFHDLGKIAVPDGILNKPGRLSPEEFTVMKAHPTVGADLCRGLRTMEKVLPLIRHHHEKLDGSGYPDGLTAREIPPIVRIISVVDVYDALATRRPYKDPFPPGKCLTILREESAKGWWDRDVVEALARVLGLP